MAYEMPDDGVDRVVDALQTGQLIPPVKSVHVLTRRDGSEYVEIVVLAEHTPNLEQAITSAASPVPIDIIWTTEMKYAAGEAGASSRPTFAKRDNPD